MDLEFLAKSLPLQIAIGGGYLGYLAAYTGIRSHHQQTDVAFLTIAFGLVASAVANQMTRLNYSNSVVIFIAVAASVATGFLWRKVFRGLIRWLLRTLGITYADDDPSVFINLASDTKNEVRQVMVSLDDGRELWCDDTAKFNDAPLHPVIFGGDGSVAMYVTHVYTMSKDGVEKELVADRVQDPKFGDNMSFISAGSIKHIDVRLRPKPRSKLLAWLFGRRRVSNVLGS